MIDPVSIATIASAILAFTGPVLRTLWTKIKSFYGRVCKTSSVYLMFLEIRFYKPFLTQRTTGYLQQLDRNQFTRDLQTILSTGGPALMSAVQEHYLPALGSEAASNPQRYEASRRQIAYHVQEDQEDAGYSSDFSEFEF